MSKFNKNKFDERQLWIRGNIFKHMYIVAAVALLLNAFLLSEDIVWASGSHSNIIILMSVTAFGSVEMIFKGVYFENSVQQRMVTSVMLTAGIMSLIAGAMHLFSGANLIENGALTDNGSMLVISMFGFIIGLGAIIKLLLDKFKKNRENENGNESEN